MWKCWCLAIGCAAASVAPGTDLPGSRWQQLNVAACRPAPPQRYGPGRYEGLCGLYTEWLVAMFVDEPSLYGFHPAGYASFTRAACERAKWVLQRYSTPGFEDAFHGRPSTGSITIREWLATGIGLWRRGLERYPDDTTATPSLSLAADAFRKAMEAPVKGTGSELDHSYAEIALAMITTDRQLSARLLEHVAKSSIDPSVAFVAAYHLTEVSAAPASLLKDLLKRYSMFSRYHYFLDAEARLALLGIHKRCRAVDWPK